MYNNYYDNLYQPYNRSPYNKISFLELNNIIRQLWEEHITWTRLAIISIANSSSDTQLVSNRLLKNATDFGNLFTNFYSPEIAQEFSQLMRDHLSIAADLVIAAKKQDNNAVIDIDRKWHKNADDIAFFLNSINPNWSRNEIQQMMYDHLSLTKNEAVAILTSKYAEGIALFDEIEKQALMMADSYINGIAKQFPNKIMNY